jgi:hypothetical protein
MAVDTASLGGEPLVIDILAALRQDKRDGAWSPVWSRCRDQMLLKEDRER